MLTPHLTPRDYTLAARVEIHPACDLWARGARYGTVTRTTTKRVYVRLDATGRVVAFLPDQLLTP